MSRSEVYFHMIEDDLNPEEVTAKLLVAIDELLNAEGIHPNEVQHKMLASHVKAMVERAKTREPLPEVERELFEDISAKSMSLAERVIKMLNDLPIEEAYLLSVHFEVASAND
jgi:PRD domain protein (TIGR03582 family)